MDHHHNENASGSAEKKVNYRFLLRLGFFSIVIIPPAVFLNFLLEKGDVLVAGRDDIAADYPDGARAPALAGHDARSAREYAKSSVLPPAATATLTHQIQIRTGSVSSECAARSIASDTAECN